MLKPIFTLLLIGCLTVSASEARVDLKEFAQDYFAKFVATQSPDASKKDLENYLALLI